MLQTSIEFLEVGHAQLLLLSVLNVTLLPEHSGNMPQEDELGLPTSSPDATACHHQGNISHSHNLVSMLSYFHSTRRDIRSSRINMPLEFFKTVNVHLYTTDIREMSMRVVTPRKSCPDSRS